MTTLRALTLTWKCLGCPEHGTTDLEARKHGDATKHATTTVTVPK
ncbi:MAG: hypothetical protein ACOH10_07880 [Rhodoglobus sp.]